MIAVIAFAGVGMAAVYALRLFITSMHNRVGPKVGAREMSVAEGLVLWPLVLVVLALALYPQLAMERGERAVEKSLAGIEQVTGAEATEAPGHAAADDEEATP